MVELSTDPGSNKSSVALELMNCAGSSVSFFQANSDTVEANGYADFYSPWINGKRIKVVGGFFVCCLLVFCFVLFVFFVLSGFFPNKIDGDIKSIALLRFYRAGLP